MALLRVVLGVCLTCAACATDAAQRSPAAAAPSSTPSASPTAAAPSPAPAAEAPAESAPPSSVRIKGLTGTLNKDDVHQTMDARQPAFDACITQVRRRLRSVCGSIQFAFKVDGQGAIEDVHPIESTVGHGALERCLLDAVAATTFPKPAGRATAEFTWDIHVEPAGGRWPATLDTELMARPLRRHARKVAQACDFARRERFHVTAYVTQKGRVLSVGAVPQPAKAATKLECVLAEVATWRTPRVERTGKVSFELR